jgi:BASS family bile acid:Na+ symporter
MKAGGRSSYAIGLLVAVSLLAIVIVPVAVAVLGRALSIPMHMPPAAVVRLVFLTVLVPMAVGVGVRHVAPGIAERIADPVSRAATVLLVISILPVAFILWPAMVSLVGNGTLLAIGAFTLAGLAAGHLLGGPDPDDCTVLALATAFRHPGVAVAFANVNFPGETRVPAAVLLYLIVSTIVSIPYLTWRRRVHGRVDRALEA